MSPAQAPRPWLSLLGGLLAAALSVALLVDTKSLPVADHRSVPLPPVPPAAANSAALPTPAPSALPVAIPVTPDLPLAAAAGAPPAGVTAEQWRHAQHAMADHPAREAELARLADYLAFKNRADRFQALRQQPGAAGAELAELAHLLDSALPERLARREVGAGEARLLKLALLQVIQPDELLRSQALAGWARSEAQLASGRQGSDPRDAQWQRRQAEATSAWLAQPEALRDPKALEAQLQTLREQIYGPGR